MAASGVQTTSNPSEATFSNVTVTSPDASGRVVAGADTRTVVSQVARGVPPYCVDDIVGFGFQPGELEGMVTLYELCGQVLLETTPAIRAEALSLRRTDPINSSVEAYLSKSDFRA